MKSLSVQFVCVFLPPLLYIFCFCQARTISVLYLAHLCMKCSLGISNFLEKVSSRSHSMFPSISLHWLLRKALLSLLAILWNSAFRWIYLSFSPLPFQLCPALCDCSLPGSSVHGIFQVRILEWFAISFFSWASRPRDQTYISYVSCIAGGFFMYCAIREALPIVYISTKQTLASTCCYSHYLYADATCRYKCLSIWLAILA